jgi:hypothetical protein
LFTLGSQNAFAFTLQCQRQKQFHAFAGTRRTTTSSQIGSSTAYYNSYNEDLLPGIAAIDAANAELLSKLEVLRDQPYFRFYSIDILASCEYMPQELYECYTQTCEIYPEDGDQVRITIVYVSASDDDGGGLGVAVFRFFLENCLQCCCWLPGWLDFY